MTIQSSERARAAQFINQIVQSPDRTIDRVLAEKSATPLERELVSGVLRRYFSLSAKVDALLKKPMRDKDQDLYHLLLVGAYQLQYTAFPAHAAVNETVNAVPVMRKPWARGLVNGVMRTLTRQRSDATSTISTEHSFEVPVWLSQLVLSQYPNGAEVLESMLERAPMCIRINSRKRAPAEYLEQLQAQLQVAFTPLWFDESIVLAEPMPQTSLPGYDEGQVSVQDGAAQFAAHLLDLQPGSLWLDACAAPGGKLFHGLELHPECKAVAVELSEPRSQNMRRQAQRLGHSNFDLHTANALEEGWWDGKSFDAILLDAPCSGTGTLRRNPDIKLHRTVEQLAQLTLLQQKLTTKLWSLLKPGGSLLYCTCSILQQENDAIISNFLNQNADARCVGLTLPTGKATSHGWQLLPTDPNTDGFYYAKLHKVAS